MAALSLPSIHGPSNSLYTCTHPGHDYIELGSHGVVATMAPTKIKTPPSICISIDASKSQGTALEAKRRTSAPPKNYTGSMVTQEFLNKTAASLREACERSKENGGSQDEAVTAVLEDLFGVLTRYILVALVKKVPGDVGLIIFQWAEIKQMISPHLGTVVLGALGRSRQWEKAEALVKEMERKGFELDLYVHNVMITMYTRADSYVKAMEWYDSMRARGLVPNKIVLTTVIKLLSKANRMADALSLCEELRKMEGAAQDHNAMCTIISVYGRAGRLKEAEATFAEVQAGGKQFDQAVWVSMASVYRKFGRCEDVECVIRQMEAAGVPATAIAYNAVIDVYAETGQLAKAENVLQVMHAKGVAPDLITFNTMLAMYGRNANEVEQSAQQKVEDIFRMMEANGSTPDCYTHNNVIWLYSNVGRVQQAFEHFRKLQAAGFAMSPVLHGTMITALVRAKKDLPAAALYKEMEAAGLQPDTVLRETMAGVFRRLGMDVEKQKVLKADKFVVEKQGSQLSRSAAIALFAKSGRLPDALKVYEEMRDSGEEIDIVSQCAMMDAYGKHGQIEAAHSLFVQVVDTEAGRSKTVPYSIMINLYAKTRRFKEAQDIFMRLNESGAAMDGVVYNTMIDLLGKEGKAEEAAALFEDMLQQGVPPTNFTYTNMIHMYGAAGRILEATKMFSRMQDAGVCPNVVTFNTVINIYRKLRMYRDAYNVYSYMKKEGIKPSKATYATLILMYEEAGQCKLALRIFKDMKKRGPQPDKHIINYMIRICTKAGLHSHVWHLMEQKHSMRGISKSTDAVVTYKPAEEQAAAERAAEQPQDKDHQL